MSLGWGSLLLLVVWEVVNIYRKAGNVDWCKSKPHSVWFTGCGNCFGNHAIVSENAHVCNLWAVLCIVYALTSFSFSIWSNGWEKLRQGLLQLILFNIRGCHCWPSGLAGSRSLDKAIRHFFPRNRWRSIRLRNSLYLNRMQDPALIENAMQQAKDNGKVVVSGYVCGFGCTACLEMEKMSLVNKWSKSLFQIISHFCSLTSLKIRLLSKHFYQNNAYLGHQLCLFLFL